MAWTQADVDAINARRGAKLPAHVPTPRNKWDVVTDAKTTEKKSKYRNVRTMIGGESFDSKREADYWLVLKAREQLGEIQLLRRQVRYDLNCPDETEPRHDLAMSRTVAHYVADYVYYDLTDGREHVVDAKGHRTREYQLKKKWLELQDGIVIEEV